MFLFHLPAVSRIDPPPAPLVALARRALECARRRAGVPEDSPPFFLSRVDLLPKDGRGASGGGASGGGGLGTTGPLVCLVPLARLLPVMGFC